MSLHDLHPHESAPDDASPLTLGFVTDLHFGPQAFFEGKLRKLTHHAAELTRNATSRDP